MTIKFDEKPVTEAALFAQTLLLSTAMGESDTSTERVAKCIHSDQDAIDFFLGVLVRSGAT